MKDDPANRADAERELEERQSRQRARWEVIQSREARMGQMSLLDPQLKELLALQRSDLRVYREEMERVHALHELIYGSNSKGDRH